MEKESKGKKERKKGGKEERRTEGPKIRRKGAKKKTGQFLGAKQPLHIWSDLVRSSYHKGICRSQFAPKKVLD